MRSELASALTEFDRSLFYYAESPTSLPTPISIDSLYHQQPTNLAPHLSSSAALSANSGANSDLPVPGQHLDSALKRWDRLLDLPQPDPLGPRSNEIKSPQIDPLTCPGFSEIRATQLPSDPTRFKP